MRQGRGQEEARGLVVDVARLAAGGEALRGEIPVALLDYDQDDLLFHPAGPLRYDLFAERLDEELLVRGVVEEDLSCTCVRCGRDFDWTARDGDVSFSVEVAPDAFADLTAELRECIILSFPSNPLCKEDCKGLCPRCGADLNLGPCGCGSSGEGDLRWGGLDALGGAER